MAEKATEFKNLGNAAFKEQKFTEAAELFSKAIEANPIDHVLYSNRSGAYASLNDYEKALEDANKCVEIKADWPKGYIRKGLAEFYLKKFDEAIATYDTGLTFDPSNAQMKEGKQRAENGKYTGGQDVPGMDQAKVAGVIGKLKANPKTAKYLEDPAFLQQVQMFMGNPEMMQKNPQMMMQLLGKDPRFMDCFMVLQGLDPEAMGKGGPGGQGDMPEEEEIVTEDIPKKQEAPPKKEEQKVNIDEATSIKNEGNVLYKQKKFEEALVKYDQAIQLKPEDLLFYNNKAAAFIELKQLDKALECCQLALKIREDKQIYDFLPAAKIYARLGSIYEKMGDLQNARDYLDKSLLEDHNGNVKLELRRVEQLLKKKKEQDYLDPVKADAANEAGKQLFKDGSFKEALDQYTEAVKRQPDGPKQYFNRGLCFIKLMDWHKAVEDFDKCIELDENYTKAYIKKGDCLSFMKEFHKAKGAYEKAKSQDPTNQEVLKKMQDLQMKMYTSGGTKEEQEQRASQAMKDPEVQKIMMTPEVQNALKQIQQSPQEAMKIMQDPFLGPKIQILIEAGIIRMG